MPTKTKPKNDSWNTNTVSAEEITVRSKDLDILFECIEIDRDRQPKKSARVEKALIALLKRLVYVMQSAKIRPLPSHLVAALEPIKLYAGTLKKLLNPSEMSVQLLSALDVMDVDNGNAWDVLSRIESASTMAIASRKEESGSGQHVKRYAEQLKSAEERLSIFFENVRKPPKIKQGTAKGEDVHKEYQGAKQEFLKVCKKYLPKSSTAAKSSRAPKV